MGVDGFLAYTVRPDDNRHGPHIVHLHGGAYVEEIEPHHWRFAARLAHEHGCWVTLPIYPLAPRYESSTILPMVERSYHAVLRTYAPRKVFLAGDSAGAALALAVAQRLRATGGPQPQRLLLFSPWLDITLPDPLSERIEPSDPLLAVAGLREAGRLYTGNGDRTDPEISPEYAHLPGLAPMSVFIGTRDILLPEARRLIAAAQRDGIDVDYFEQRGMFHNWLMQPIPEAESPMSRIADTILGSPR
ncbi:alpha/beta hydrolase fold domain-containing protein [Sciscionella sediminilitoris]|uniref:alpha/beta hydrolase fold domain-containing protein n=1 Tax=Sciscionella sediminilitoris TaxID=1445613 RepID=UPI001E3EFE28|nr:alpha/beta hydrolase [Sciscionella sp. SE31]